MIIRCAVVIIRCDLYDILSNYNMKQMAHFVPVLQDNVDELVTYLLKRSVIICHHDHFLW